MLKKLNLHAIDLSDIHPRWIETFYRLAQTYDSWELRRMMPESKRYALLLCFLTEAHQMLLDDIIQLNNRLLLDKERQSRNQYQKNTKAARRQARENEKIMIAALEQLYQEAIKESAKIIEETAEKTAEKEKSNTTTLLEFVNQLNHKLNNDKVQKAIAACKAFHEYEEAGLLRELELRYATLRKYTPRFFELDFKAAKGAENLMDAIAILNQLNNGSLKKLPLNAPCNFVPITWRTALHRPDGSLHQRTWELALYYAVRNALETTDLSLPHSRYHRNFWESLYNEPQWQQEKLNAYAQLKLPNEFETMLTTLRREFSEQFQVAKQGLQQGDFASLDTQGNLKLHREDALDIPSSVRKLHQQIEARMPIIRIEKLVEEVDHATQFFEYFVPPKGFDPKSTVPRTHLHAAILAHATNMGLYGMAHSVESITLDELRNASRWLINTDTLKAGNTCLVNAHCQNPFSQIFGDGQRSSSDAQRFGIRASSVLASFYPRFFGYYDKAISIYTHTSSLYSVFSTLVISCGVREATYVLTGLLSNDSILNPQFHCTDTHGFTHHVFALCYLFGVSFQPRLKDIASQQLFKIDKNVHYGEFENLFSGAVDIALIEEQWDNLVKIIASLKNNLLPAHIIVEKLARRSLSDRTAKALMELGKAIKTIFILRYLGDIKLRHAVQLQLNRGEHRHYLAQHLFFADQGVFKTNNYDDIMNKASCLSFVSNAVLYWNTRQIEKIVDQLVAEGYPVNRADLEKISPLMFKHIIVHGIYQFEAQRR